MTLWKDSDCVGRFISWFGDVGLHFALGGVDEGGLGRDFHGLGDRADFHGDVERGQVADLENDIFLLVGAETGRRDRERVSPGGRLAKR